MRGGPKIAFFCILLPNFGIEEDTYNIRQIKMVENSGNGDRQYRN